MGDWLFVQVDGPFEVGVFSPMNSISMGNDNGGKMHTVVCVKESRGPAGAGSQRHHIIDFVLGH